MRRLMKLIALGLVLGLTLQVGCEDSDLIAPSDGQILVEASPGTVTIDPNAAETRGQSVITALVLDSSGFPLGGIAVAFFSTAGTLDSQSPPGSIETNSQGVATDVLTLTENDPESVEVTARSATLSGSTTVLVDNLGINRPPVALASAIPNIQAEIGATVIFDGSQSSDPDVEDRITCYKWTITSSVDLPQRDLECIPQSDRCEVIQGPGQQTVTKSTGYAEEQSLNVVLQVTDDPLANPLCSPSGPAANLAAFSTDSSLITGYQIVCVNPSPVARAGANDTVQVGMPVDLNGSASTDNTGISNYKWECGNGQEQSGTDPVVTCTYTFSQAVPFIATLTVTDDDVDCPRTDTDTVQITVVPLP